MLNSSTIRPGLLVSLKTAIHGGVQYRTSIIDSEQISAEGVLHAKWETEKTIADAAEHDAAVKARAKARNLVSRICAQTDFGLLCPQANEALLANEVEAAREIADAFNRTATHSRISVFVITGRVAQDDAEAIRSINSEIKELLDIMEQGIRVFDPTSIRKAANRARQISPMLSADANARVQVAVDAAREAAKDIKRVAKAGEIAAQVIDEIAIEQITAMRTSFLDFSEAGAVAEPVEPGRAVDFDTSPALEGMAAEANASAGVRNVDLVES